MPCTILERKLFFFRFFFFLFYFILFFRKREAIENGGGFLPSDTTSLPLIHLIKRHHRSRTLPSRHSATTRCGLSDTRSFGHGIHVVSNYDLENLIVTKPHCTAKFPCVLYYASRFKRRRLQSRPVRNSIRAKPPGAVSQYSDYRIPVWYE